MPTCLAAVNCDGIGLNKLMITGANGVGKSHFAARMSAARPEVPLVSFDALKLETGWRQRSRTEIEASLADEIAKDAWILEGGPSLLFQAVEKADALIWLDPPEVLRAWRLVTRPWKYIGKTRPELPDGNVDWPLEQYRFALRSLRKRSQIRSYISEVFQTSSHLRKWRCRNDVNLAEAIRAWAEGGPER